MPHNELPPGVVIPAEAEDATSLLEYWRILVERRAVLLTCLTACVAVGLLYTFLSTPLYQATTTLQIERKGPEVFTFEDVLGVDPAGYGYLDYYQTQYKIIQSRTVLRDAAEKMDLANRPEFVNRTGSPLSRFVGWAKSLVSSSEAGEYDPVVAAAGFIAGNLTVSPVRQSHLVNISFTDRDAKLARDVANAVADAYQWFSLSSRRSTSTQASNLVTTEVLRLKTEIRNLEAQLQEGGDTETILDLSDGTQDITEQALADLNSRLTEARGRKALAEARYTEIENQPQESLPEVLSSLLISNLKQRYAEVERQYSQMDKRFKPDWPALTQLQNELDQAQERLEIETASIAEQVRQVAKAQYEQAVAEVRNLERQVESQKKEMQRVNRGAIEWAALMAEIESRRKVLDGLMARQSETIASGQLGLGDSKASNIHVVDKAETPDWPVKPNKTVNLALSLMIGLGLGMAMAFLLHYVDNTIKTEHDIQRYGEGAAVLGHVPLYEPLRVLHGGRKHGPEPEQKDDSKPLTATSPYLACHDAPRSSFAEAFKNLRTSLLLASADHPPRRIHVTSCEPGDGKSTVSLNLAIVLTQTGRRTLLIDADLRRPRIHHALDLPNEVGLSSCLTGNAEPEQILQDSGIPLLTVITSGPTPPNPSELLGSSGLDALLARLDKSGKYDHIILDSPPAIHVADSVILATRADATILTVRAGSTPRESLAEAGARLRSGRARVVGTLLNAVSERSGYYYRQRGYYYRYEDPSHDDETQRSWPRLPASLSLSSRKRKQGQRRAG